MATSNSCGGCNYNGQSSNNPPIIPDVNYQFNLESFEIPPNLYDYFIKALQTMNVDATIINPLKGRFKKFFDQHKNGDYSVGSMLLAWCIIIHSNFVSHNSYCPEIIHTMKVYLERAGYDCDGTVAVDVFFMGVL